MRHKPIKVCETHDRQQWLRERQNGIGSSDAPAIMELPGAFGDPLSVYATKHGHDVGFTPDEEVKRWGNITEPMIGWVACAEITENKWAQQAVEAGGMTLIRAIAESTQPGHPYPYRYRPIMLAHPKHPWLRATIDNWIRLRDGRVEPMECKNVRWRSFDWDRGIPKYVWLQIQVQLEVSGADTGYVARLIGGSDLGWKKVEYDARYCEEEMIPALRRFWDDVIAERKPEPGSTKYSTKALKALYPKDDGSLIQLGESALDLHDERMVLKEQEKEAKTKLVEVENKLRGLIGDATEATLPGGIVYTYKANKKGVRSLHLSTKEEAGA